jgi:hypothetical protein
MTVTFLQAVNASLKRARVIQGDSGELATSTVTSTATGLTATGAFTDSSRQTQIDIMLQIWNELEHELYSRGMFAPEVASATMTLVTNQREYTMPSNFERFAADGVWRGATHQWLICEYPGGYAQMLKDQPGLASQWEGEPNGYAISPVSTQTIRLDMNPNSTINGWTYNVLYEKRLQLTASMATEALPWSDTITDALVPVAAVTWEATYKEKFNPAVFQTSIARALEFAGQKQRRTFWGPTVGRGY